MAALPALPTLLPLPEAARKYGLDEAHLRSLVEKGRRLFEKNGLPYKPKTGPLSSQS